MFEIYAEFGEIGAPSIFLISELIFNNYEGK